MASETGERGPWYEGGLSFSCTQCGNCCTGPPGYVWFDEAEGERMAEHFGMTVQAFREKYAHRVGEGWSLNERRVGRGYDCVFLERDDEGRGLCSIYSVRPVQCRTWPFWDENLSTPAAWRRAAKDCPGIDQGKLYPVEHIRIQRDRTPGA